MPTEEDKNPNMNSLFKNSVVIIPARGGSKRLPNKNILALGNYPLVVHSIKYAQLHGIPNIFVSTEDEKIKSIALSNKCQVIERPEYLSGDEVPTVAVLEHALKSLNDNFNDVILLQPTNPFRPKSLLVNAMQIYREQQFKSLFTVSRIDKKLGKISNNKYIPYNYKFGQRSQDLDPLFFENGLLYITDKKLINEGIIFNENSYPLEVNHKFAEVDIDTKADFEYAEYILKCNYDK